MDTRISSGTHLQGPRTRPFRATPAILLAILAATLLVTLLPGAASAAPIRLPGLQAEGRIIWDAEGIPHIYASSDFDAIFLLGYVHSQDRFFQMDTLRRQASGRLAEMLGAAALPADVQLRTLGLRRAAEASMAAADPNTRAWFEAYTAGVNAWLNSTPALPPEYTALELSKASVPAWTAVDSAVIGKLLAFGLSFDLDDLDNTVALGAFQTAGAVAGFDGTALFFEDIYRTAPFDPTLSIPPGGPVPRETRADAKARTAFYEQVRQGLERLDPRTLDLARGYRERLAAIPALADTVARRDSGGGSNWWLVSGDLSDSGHAMLANDPHLALDTPSTFYEAHLMSFGGSRWRPLIASGVTFAGAPAIAQGCNIHLCWGSTVHPMDVTDVYQEELVADPATGVPVFSRYQGQLEPLVILPQSYRVNQPGNGVADDLVDSGLGPLNGGLVFVVPRRNNGPLVAIDASDPTDIVGLSVQYTGWGPTRELDAFRRFIRASNLEEFKDGLSYFDVGSQNFGVADTFGNIAYYTSAEMPIREDLQAGGVAGLPPYLIRNGTGGNEWLPVSSPQPNQSLPYEILPFEEMPQLVNPASGYIANANNDPIGTSLDNNPLNQLRPGGGLYYLNPGYSDLRIGRIDALLKEAIASGSKITAEDLQRMQGNNQMLDAELLTPLIVAAWDRTMGPTAPPELAPFGLDDQMGEAVFRLDAWDFSTPTGTPEGFDPGDDPTNLPEPSRTEIANSVAATIYSVWRGQMIRLVVDDTLAAVGLGDFAPGSTLAFRAMAHQLQDFDTLQGVGASGLDFFGVAGASSPEAARDRTILTALRAALDLLAGDEFAAAFGGSEIQEDYRWGKLHRIVFDHFLGGPFSVPGGGGLDSVSPELPGVGRSGGYETVDASTHGTRGASANGFTFGSGPARRFVGVLRPGEIEAYEVIPGGQSGNFTSPLYADQLRLWLTNHYHPLVLSPADVQTVGISQQRYLP